MRGMDASTGCAIEGDAHLRQSIADILTTPLGSRVMRREYGSLLPGLIDAPFNPSTRVQLYGAIATALMRWEKRIQLTKVDVVSGEMPGRVVVTLEGRRTGSRQSTEYTSLTLPLTLRAN